MSARAPPPAFCAPQAPSFDTKTTKDTKSTKEEPLVVVLKFTGAGAPGRLTIQRHAGSQCRSYRRVDQPVAEGVYAAEFAAVGAPDDPEAEVGGDVGIQGADEAA